VGIREHALRAPAVSRAAMGTRGDGVARGDARSAAGRAWLGPSLGSRPSRASWVFCPSDGYLRTDRGAARRTVYGGGTESPLGRRRASYQRGVLVRGHTRLVADRGIPATARCTAKCHFLSGLWGLRFQTSLGVPTLRSPNPGRACTEIDPTGVYSAPSEVRSIRAERQFAKMPEVSRDPRSRRKAGLESCDWVHRKRKDHDYLPKVRD
jgi:hypothetical protein